MSSKAQRKRAAKRRRQANRVVQIETSDLQDLPRPLRLMVEGQERLAEHLSGVTNFAEAREKAERCIEGLVQEVVELTDQFDVFDLVECMKLAEGTADPEKYRETEHEGLASAIELAAVILISRGTRHGAASAIDGHRVRADHVIDRLRKLTHEMLNAGSMLLLTNTVEAGDVEAGIALSAVLREVHLRNVTYPHMLEETLAGLFDRPDIASDCQAALGCSVAEVRLVIRAIHDLHSERWNQRMKSLQEFAEVARVAYGQRREGTLRDSDSGALEQDVPPELVDRARSLWDAVWDDPADASVLEPAHLAERSQLPVETVAAAIRLLTLDIRPADPIEMAMRFLSGRSPFRTTPILRDPDGSAMPAHDGLLLPAVRDRVEEVLKATSGWDRYAKHRGEFLEDVGITTLESILRGATTYRGFEYFVPTQGSLRPEVQPSEYTKLVEGDGLLVLDDVAIILEAKGGALGPESRAGDRGRLRGDLRKLITAAADQALRMRTRISEDRGLRLRDGTWLDLSHVREIHSVAVTLEDLSQIATVTADLVEARILSADHLPWTVSVHDLRIIADLVDRPAEFLLYLRRRTEPAATLLYKAVDELDLFLEFFATGLFVERHPEEVRQALPTLGEPTVAEIRRYRAQRPEMLTSRTDRLDSWYFYKLGVRSTPCDKPSHNARPFVKSLVDWLARQGVPGWFSIGATLLAMSSGTQDNLSRVPRKLGKLTRRDRMSHSYTAFMGGNGPDSALLVWATVGRDERQTGMERCLRSYLEAKKYQTKAATAACFIIDPDHIDEPAGFLFNNDLVRSDPELDQMVASSGLRPLGRPRRVDRIRGSGCRAGR